MAEDVADLTFEHLRRIEAKLDRVLDEISDPKVRVTAVEEQLTQIELSVAGGNRRIGWMEARVERIERRLDLVELPH